MLVRARGLCAALLSAALSLAACSQPNALLLKVSADRQVSTFDFTVRDLTTLENVAETKGQALPADQDISKPGQELKLAVRFQTAGTYLVYVAGRDNVGVQVAARSYRVEGTVDARLKLTAIPPGGDQDGDGFPSAASCAQMASDSFDCTYADCNDGNPDTNPLATERCNGFDDDCDGKLGPDETDADGDGFLKCLDCDPSDETDFNFAEYHDCRDCDDTRADVHPASRRDPTDYPAATEDCHNCGDGVDHNCDGKLNPCNDADCDGFPGCGKEGAPPAPDCDCNDQDPAIHPGATEVCGDQIDNNCDGQTDEGCLPCDIDGDGFMRDDPANGCNPPPGQADCDDTDSSVYPGAAASCNGSEGGCRDMALRGFCHRDAQGQVTIHDCNHRNAQNDPKCPLTDPTCSGCPDPACDHDGDGFLRYDPANGCNPPAGLADCDDEDPHTFPGAPDKCGDGKAQNCNLDTQCTDDADGDGYNSADDCDDSDPNRHPWATELCNGQDDDCDGLTDEGNPDSTTGQTVAGTQCTDSDVGECAKKQGACICSRLVPVGTRNSASRRPCKDEDLTAVASPRCFGAGQPQQETAQSCDGLDEDCDGVPDDAPGEVPCATGTACKWASSVWKCACDNATGCSGCCMHASPADYCVYIESVTVGQCGTGGEDCHTCSDGNVCTTDSCAQGQCQNANLADHAACPGGGGQCRVPNAGGAAQCCGTCWLGNGCAASVDSGCGAAGGDCLAPNTACGTCKACNGAGSCGNVPTGQDPNSQCPDDGVATCGRTGVCDGSGACALYAAGSSCATCKTCNGTGSCTNVPDGQDPNNECSDEGGCGHDGACNGGGACRYYPGTKSCGTCKQCNGAGACATNFPSDDATCGTISCAGLTTTCRAYSDITTNRCLSFGTCKPANNTSTCTSYVNANQSTKCGGATPCENCDGSGTCSRTPADDSGCGTIPCHTLNTTCRGYNDLTANRCKSFGACKQVNTTDCTSITNQPATTVCATCVLCDGNGNCTNNVPNGGSSSGACSDQGATSCGTDGLCNGSGGCQSYPSGTDCGLCTGCNGTGTCNQAVSDDSTCGTIACSTLNTTCRTYTDLTTNRCKSLGTCKSANTTDCTIYANTSQHTACGACHECDGNGNCVPLADHTACGTCHECLSGSCTPVADHTACGTCHECLSGTCGAVSDGTGCGTCKSCQGGTCQVVSNGSDPNSDCTGSQTCCNGACCGKNVTCCPSGGTNGCCSNNNPCSGSTCG